MPSGSHQTGIGVPPYGNSSGGNTVEEDKELVDVVFTIVDEVIKQSLHLQFHWLPRLKFDGLKMPVRGLAMKQCVLEGADNDRKDDTGRDLFVMQTCISRI